MTETMTVNYSPTQDYKTLFRSFLATGKLFEDGEFCAEASVLTNECRFEDVEWLRPCLLYTSDAADE